MMLGGELYSFDPDDLRTLWKLRELERSVGRQTASYWSVAWATWSKKWSRMRAGHERGLQIIRRQTFAELCLRRAAEALHRVDPGNAARVAAGSARPGFLGKLRLAPRVP
jgi:hypothetical protein